MEEKDCTSCIYYRKPMECEVTMNELVTLKRCHCWIDKDGNEY